MPNISPAEKVLPAPAYGGVMFRHDNEIHELVFVEYYKQKPSAVLTVEHWDCSKKAWFVAGKHEPNGHSLCCFDFDWCRRYGMLYQHMSGCGGDIRAVLGCLANPTEPPSWEFWAAPGLPLYRAGKSWRRPIRVRNQVEMIDHGYRPLRQPRLLTAWDGTKSRNPFDAAEHDSTVYCRRCKDDLPSDNVCEHLYWCDDCGEWYYEDNRMDHDSETFRCECEDRDAD